jgi:hypothetical protein
MTNRKALREWARKSLQEDFAIGAATRVTIKPIHRTVELKNG